MSKIEELIKEKCPDGVEFKKIIEIAQVSIGEFVHKNNQSDDAPYPVYNGGTSNTGFYEKYNRTENKIIISARGANAGFVNRVFTKYWSGNSCYTIDVQDNKVNWTYVYFYLKNNEQQLVGVQQNGGIPAISKKQVEEFEIAIPPIEVQQEIVHILDKFTELEAELQTELEARRKQRVYLINKSFEFDDSIPMIPLGEIADVQRGGSFQKKDFAEQGMPCIHYGQLYTRFGLEASKTLTYLSEKFSGKHKIATKNDVVMAVTSENVDDVCTCLVWNGDEDISVSGHAAIIHSNQLGKYLVYYFNTDNFYVQKSRIAQGTKVIEVSPEKLKNVLIPIPSIEIQKEIVKKLDYIDNLCNDYENGLPAEIEARHKQYEYYRDKLLTFERKVV